MKLKITPIRLICVILVQLILIDAIMITFFIKEIGAKNNKAKTEAVKIKKSNTAKPEAVKVEKSNTANPQAVKVEKSTTAEKQKEKQINNNATKREYLKSFVLVDNVFENSFIKKMLDAINYREYKPRDFKLKEDPLEKRSFIATTYDLSYQSCGKYPSNPLYGITFSGKKAVKGRTIAVDPNVIPLGSSVFIRFPGEYSTMDGWYVAEDTGSKVKGSIIDVYLGESAFYQMEKFGRRNVDIKVIYPEVNKIAIDK